MVKFPHPQYPGPFPLFLSIIRIKSDYKFPAEHVLE